MITADVLREFLGVKLPPVGFEVLLYGYSFERNSLYVFFAGETLVRLEEKHGDIIEWVESVYVQPEIWTRGVKRWYRGATNPKLRELVESFLETGLPETDGGDVMKGERVYFTKPFDKRLIIGF